MFSTPRILSLLTAGLLSLRGLAGAAEPVAPAKTPNVTNLVVVPKLSGPVMIDGEINEWVWAEARVLQPFVHNRDGSAEREHTELRLWYDDQALYLGWNCQDTNIQATLTNRDAPLFQEDAVEFFVTAKGLTNYFEFEWNPLGTVFDAAINNHLRTNGLSRYFRGDSSFTAHTMTSAARVKGRLGRSGNKDTDWSVEVRLPFADLGYPPPHAGDVWRFNAFRMNRTQGLPTESLSWSPTRLPSFHEPSRFGYLQFGD